MQATFGLDDQALPTLYPGAVYRWLVESGYNAEDLLANTALTAEQLSKPEALISFRQQRQLIINALRLSGDPHLGLRFGQQLNLTSHGMAGFAAMSSATLGDALEITIKYFSLRAPLLVLEFYQDDRAHIRVTEALELGPIRYFMFEGFFSAMQRMLASLLGNQPLSLTGSVSYAQPNTWPYDTHGLSFDLRFSRAFNELSLPLDYLSNKLALADPVAKRSAIEVCDSMLKNRGINTGVAGEIANRLRAQLYDFSSLDEMAASLFTSPRTLRRELNKLSITYQTILDNVRKEIAIDKLSNSTASIQEVTQMLGYSEPTNFSRAFKQWTGITPKAYRYAPNER